MYQYLKRFEPDCPDGFFEVGKRCSHPLFEMNASSLAKKSKNLACEIADFSVKAARINYQRHELVEEFILVNDTATIAVEVPVW